MRSVEFPEYNGWVNQPTWSAFTVLTSYDESRVEVETRASTGTAVQGIENVQSWLQKALEGWFQGIRSPYTKAIDMFMKEMLSMSVSYVDWYAVREELKINADKISEADEITQAAFTFWLSGTRIEEPSKNDTELDADAKLRDALLAYVYDWIEKKSIRIKATEQRSPLAQYIKTAFDLFVGVIDWNELIEALRGDETNEENSTTPQRVETTLHLPEGKNEGRR